MTENWNTYFSNNNIILKNNLNTLTFKNSQICAGILYGWPLISILLCTSSAEFRLTNIIESVAIKHSDVTSRITRHGAESVETLNHIIYWVKRQLGFYRRFFIFSKYIRKTSFVNCCCFHFKIPNLVSLFVEDFIFDRKISWAKDILHSQTKASDFLKLV